MPGTEECDQCLLHAQEGCSEDTKNKCLWREAIGVQDPVPPVRSRGIVPCPLLACKASFLWERGTPTLRRYLGPGGHPERVSLSLKSSSRLGGCLSAPGPHPQLVPRLETEVQQESTGSVPQPQIRPGLACESASRGSGSGHPSISLLPPSPSAPWLRGSLEPSMCSPWPF